jgi:hypothetical protein
VAAIPAAACVVGAGVGTAVALAHTARIGASGSSGVSGSSGASGVSGTSGPTGTPSGRTAVRIGPPATVRNAVATLRIGFNGAPDSGGPTPTFAPAVAGSWADVGNNEVFTPTVGFTPCGSYKLTIPGATTVGLHNPLGAAVHSSFTVACPSITALQEALARLNYLPERLASFYGVNLNVPLTVALATQRAYELPAGDLHPYTADTPPLKLGTMDPTTTGALEIYDADHDIPAGTAPNAAFWRRLLLEEADNIMNPRPYTWVTVSENLPETLKLHKNKRVVFTTLVNTGVPGATTQTGAFPIYVRYLTTTMVGTNVNGTHYDDPGIPWVNYFNGGDAVHGYIRASYGFPQSNGCVELPYAAAETVYKQLAVGDMVIVSA